MVLRLITDSSVADVERVLWLQDYVSLKLNTSNCSRVKINIPMSSNIHAASFNGKKGGTYDITSGKITMDGVTYQSVLQYRDEDCIIQAFNLT
jgi:hypothetical protein